MTLPRTEVVPGLLAEYGRFRDLLRTLDESEWRKTSRCSGWDVAGVASHVTGQLVDAVNGRVEGLGTPEVTAREVAERQGRSPAEIADELEQATVLGETVLASFDDAAWDGPAPGAPDLTLGEGIEAFW